MNKNIWWLYLAYKCIVYQSLQYIAKWIIFFSLPLNACKVINKNNAGVENRPSSRIKCKQENLWTSNLSTNERGKV